MTNHPTFRATAIAGAVLLTGSMHGCVATGKDPSAPSTANQLAATASQAAQTASTITTFFSGPRNVDTLRDPKLRTLFAKDKVNGADLYDTLTELRADLQKRKTAKAWAIATFAAQQVVEQPMAGANVFDVVVNQARDAAIKVAVEELRSRALGFGYKALDQHFSALLGSDMRAVLAEESINLPNAAGLDDNGARRLLTMATMVVAARVTARVLDGAEKDFKSLEPDYKNLLVQREQAAELLFRLVDARREAQRSGDNNRRRQIEQSMLARGALTQQDLRYIDTAMNTMSLAEFVDDMGAQNLALRYLQATDKKAFEGYAVKRNSVVVRTDAYLKTVSGVGAFAGFSTLFAEAVSDQLRGKRNDALLSTLPMVMEFVTATVPVVQRVGSVVVHGVSFPSFLKRNDIFVVRAAGGEDQPLKSSSEVFKAVQAAGATDLFTGVFFREDGMGWLNGVRRCDSAEAGRLVDTAVLRPDRSSFATAYFGEAAKEAAGEYSFVNAFTAPSLGEREARLGDQLLGRDHRRRTADQDLTTVQNKVSSNYSDWSNQQLLRLIFSNRDASFAHANVDLGRISIRPKPSPEAVYVFESYVNACAARSDPGRRTTAAPAPAPAPVPASRPRQTGPAPATPKAPAPAPAPR